MAATKEHFFKTDKRGSRSKNRVSEHKAMQIAATEAAERTSKTARLRQLREAKLTADQSADQK